MSTDITPFRGRRQAAGPQMIVLHRFIKPGRVMEVCERKLTQWKALEFLCLIDGTLIETQMFHGARLADYPSALAALIEQYESDGWVRDDPPSKLGH